MKISVYEWLLDHRWAMEVAIAVILLWVLRYCVKKFFLRSQKLEHCTSLNWQRELAHVALPPIRAFLWILLLSFLAHLISREWRLDAILHHVHTLRNISIVLCLDWLLFRWKKILHSRVAVRLVQHQPSVDPASVEIVGKIFAVGIVVVSVFMILQCLGVNIIPLITFGGIGIAAIGIAGKEVIANFFGGLVLYVTRPFTIGEWVELPQKQIMGNIEEIGWCLTSMRDIQKQSIYIPNALFSTEMLINLSRMTHRRLAEVFHIRYVDISQVLPLLDAMRSLLERHTGIDSHQPIHVFLKALGSGSVDIEMQAYTVTTQYAEFVHVKQEILLSIYDLVIKAGGEIFDLLKYLHWKDSQSFGIARGKQANP